MRRHELCSRGRVLAKFFAHSCKAVWLSAVRWLFAVSVEFGYEVLLYISQAYVKLIRGFASRYTSVAAAPLYKANERSAGCRRSWVLTAERFGIYEFNCAKHELSLSLLLVPPIEKQLGLRNAPTMALTMRDLERIVEAHPIEKVRFQHPPVQREQSTTRNHTAVDRRIPR